jgi:hypothetical protein
VLPTPAYLLDNEVPSKITNNKVSTDPTDISIINRLGSGPLGHAAPYEIIDFVLNSSKHLDAIFRMETVRLTCTYAMIKVGKIFLSLESC